MEAEDTLWGRPADGISSFCNPLGKVGRHLVSGLVFRLLSRCIRCLWGFFCSFFNTRKNLVFTKYVWSPVAAGASEKTVRDVGLKLGLLGKL